FREAASLAFESMVDAAQGLLKVNDPDVSREPGTVFDRFKSEFLDTELFYERYIGASEAQYYISAHQAGGAVRDRDEARRRVEEAQLFIEAAHACYTRLLEAQPTVAARPGVAVMP